MSLDARKALTVLETVFPFLFYSQSFSNPKEFLLARMEFYKNNLGPQGPLGDPAPTPLTVEEFLVSLFKRRDQLEYFLQILDQTGSIQNFEIELNESFSFLKSCQISSKITRFQKGEYFLQGYFVGTQRSKEKDPSRQQENRMLETILSGIGDAVCVYDRDCNVIFESPLHKRWFSSARPYMCFNRAKNRSLPVSRIRPDRFIENRADENGKPLCLEVTTYPIKNEAGELFAGINIVRDLSLTLELEAKSRELEGLKQNERREKAIRPILGDSRPIHKVLEAVDKISRLDTPVFIQGETGTGKELIARAIQKMSPRADKPFVTINCGALSETLLDSELFGHVKGAFTGADTESTGLFQAADGGTIFLDEIGEMSMGTQVKLLRVLQDGEIRKLGSTRSKKVDVRIITATHRDIQKLVGEKKFRQDLFYRIHVFTIHTPRLKDREDDVLQLADHFLREFSTAQGKKIGRISKDAALLLKEHSWPGNVRELRNVIERATILCESSTLEAKDLPLTIIRNGSGPNREPAPSQTMEESLQELSRRKILDCLEKNRWNKTNTAKDLNISRATLWRKIKEMAIQPA